MKKKSNAKDVIGLILMAIGFLGIVFCGVAAIVLNFMNPDMTELRLFLTYPWPTIGALISCIACCIGYKLVN